MCPRKSRQAGWVAVGYQRGSFRAPGSLCPVQSGLYNPDDAEFGVHIIKASNGTTSESLNASHHVEAVRRSQDLAIARLQECHITDDPLLKVAGMRELVDAVLGNTLGGQRPSLGPLSHCVLDVIWEFTDRLSSPSLAARNNLRHMVSVLLAAVKHQAKYETQGHSVSIKQQS